MGLAMALSDEEKATLVALQAKENEPEAIDDFEIELYTPEGHGARVPYAKGRGYLQQHFGIDLDPDPGTESGTEGGEGGNGKTPPKAGAKPPKAGETAGPTRVGLFTKRT
jgi:hypothetical protein